MNRTPACSTPANPPAPGAPCCRAAPGVLYDLDHRAGLFYLRINDTGPDFRLVTVDARAPQRGTPTELIAAAPGLMLERVDVFRHHLVVTERRNGLHALQVRDLRRGAAAAAEHLVQFDEPAFSVSASQNAEFDTTSFRFTYESMVTPATVYDYQLDSRERLLRKRQPVLGGYEASDYVTGTVCMGARAQDGTARSRCLARLEAVVRRCGRRGPQSAAPLRLRLATSTPIEPRFFSSRATVRCSTAASFSRSRTCAGAARWAASWYEDGKLSTQAEHLHRFRGLRPAH